MQAVGFCFERFHGRKMMEADPRMDIINRVKNGDLSSEEGARQLEALEFKEEAASDEAFSSEAVFPSESSDPLANLGWWRYAWQIPLWVGVFIITVSGLLLSWAVAQASLFWFYCAWLPMLLGMLFLLLGVWSRQARWVHIRVHESAGKRIAISLPVPTRFTGWVLRIVSPFVPAEQRDKLVYVPEILSALSQMKDPITVEVDEKNGDQVRVYIQ
jgi:hypothetical protein